MSWPVHETAPRYTIRSLGGALTAPGSDDKAEAMRRAVELAMANRGQQILMWRAGRPVPGHSWVHGDRAGVQK